mmetsp:Transcript_20439/g.38374  ORF Transcript_20439/g.38374 Transcript_20439/m.38374 type:complete len:226 (+) Transcript_20439:136-813(+)
MLLFNAATGNAFTTVLAGLALTTTSLPNIIFFPAFVAGFWRVLIWQTPGMTNLPALFTPFVAMTAKLPIILEQTDFFNPCSSASAAAKAPLVMSLAPAFMPFIGGNISAKKWLSKIAWSALLSMTLSLEPKLSYNVTVRSSEGGCSHEVLLPQRACPAKWSSRDVMTWCQTQHVPELVRMTQEYGIDGSTLLSLGEEDLKASGVVAPFLLRRTLNGLATLRAAGT